MLRRIHFFLFLIFPVVFHANGQTATSFELLNSTLISTSGQMPFWLWANTDGKIETGNSVLNISEISGAAIFFFNDSNSFVKAGADLNYGIGDNSRYFQANQLFAKLNLNNWTITVGMEHNNLFFDGLSTSNGNIAKSRNARPYPKIGLSVSQYKPVPLLGKFLSFKGEYEEGILNDERYVDGTHLHHKSLYLKALLFANFSVEAGAEHFVMWGGTSRNDKIGDLPTGCSAYFKYIMGSQGDDDFPQMDQNNVAGNQYGTYQLLFTQKFQKATVSLNISHPFEDFSGVNLRNWPDNLIGLSVKLNDHNKFITHILYEYTNTRQQSIADSLYFWSDEDQRWVRREYDNYYNHAIYRSGVTYFQKTIPSPLFFPLKKEDNISLGPESTRFFAHHIGLKGNLCKNVLWKGMITYVQHLGIWPKPYETPRKQVSGLIRLQYASGAFPFEVEMTIAGDATNTSGNRAGFQLGILYRIGESE